MSREVTRKCLHSLLTEEFMKPCGNCNTLLTGGFHGYPQFKSGCFCFQVGDPAIISAKLIVQVYEYVFLRLIRNYKLKPVHLQYIIQGVVIWRVVTLIVTLVSFPFLFLERYMK